MTSRLRPEDWPVSTDAAGVLMQLASHGRKWPLNIKVWADPISALLELEKLGLVVGNPDCSWEATKSGCDLADRMRKG